MVLLGWTDGRSASVPSMAFTDLSYKKFTLLSVFFIKIQSLQMSNCNTPSNACRIRPPG